MVKKAKAVPRRWTPEEEDKFIDMYGKKHTATILRSLNISYYRFLYKANVLGLGPQREADNYLTLRQLRIIMKISPYTIQRYIEEGLHVVIRCFGPKQKNRVVDLDELFVWLERHHEMFYARRIEPYALGIEPEWLRKKRLTEQNNEYKFIKYKNKSKPLYKWANEIGINPTTLSCRLKRGWTVERAFETPIQKHRRNNNLNRKE